jgi:D-alanine-D-alanine ligase
MDKATVRVGVLLGGLSAERDISRKSGTGVVGALRERGWNAVAIDVGRDLPRRLTDERIDVAWIALHGRFGEDGCVQGLLEIMGIPYTGSGVRASAIAMDKVATKRAVAGTPGVVLARDAVVRRGEPLPSNVPLPLIAKPANCGSTIGITRAYDEGGVEKAVVEALKYDDEVLLEEFVEGEEITVAVVDGAALPAVRIVPQSGFFDFEAKYTKGRTTYECPARISGVAAERATAGAVAAFRAIGCRGLARADFIVRNDDVPVFLEINTIPGMTPTSLSPMAAAAVGVTYPELVERILLGATCMKEERPEGSVV